MSYRETICREKGDTAAEAALRRTRSILREHLTKQGITSDASAIDAFLDSEYGERMAEEQIKGTPVHVQLDTRSRRFQRHYFQSARRASP